MHKVVIIGMARTPFGAFLGGLAQVTAPELGAVAIAGALERAAVDKASVSEVIMGNVLSAGLRQAPARQAMRYAGLPDHVPAMTINKVCGSGMKAVMLGAQSLLLNEAQVVVAGGMENMSLAPHLLLGARAGFRIGEQKLHDAMLHDGLLDPYDGRHMGMIGEVCAREFGFSREAQDAYAIESFRRARAAQDQGIFDNEIVPVTTPHAATGTPVTKDEGPAKVDFEKIPRLRPAFEKDGSITAANASTINDGAAALVLTSAEYAAAHAQPPLAVLRSSATHAQAPGWFTTAPAVAMRAALEKARWKIADVDLFEVNEAFAVVAMAAMRDLGIPHEKLNVHGGAIALGHPVGASGARILIALINALRHRGLRRGCAGICIGGGEATAVCLEVPAD